MTDLLPRVGNPLLEGWLALKPQSSMGMIRFNASSDDLLEAARLLEIDDAEVRDMMDRYGGDMAFVGPHMIRRQATVKYAWAIPDQEAIAKIAGYGPIVEVGAGTGYWASLLAEQTDVVALDLWPAGHPQNHWHSVPGVFYPVEVAPVEEAAAHAERTLFICWPPYAPTSELRVSEPEDPENWARNNFEIGGREFSHWRRPNDEPDMALLALLSYEVGGGRRVVYIGEGPGGCTAGPEFHALIGQGCDHWSDEPCECPEPRWREVDDVSIPQWDGMHDHVWVFERIEGRGTARPREDGQLPQG